MATEPRPAGRGTGRRADDAHVSYTVKELLADIKQEQTAGFARIEMGLEAKADKAEVARVEARLDGRLDGHSDRLDRQEGRIADVEAALHDEQTGEVAVQQWTIRTWSRFHKLGAGVVGLFVIVSPILGPYLANHLG